VRPVIARGAFGYRSVNVTAQRSDPTSLLSWMQRLISVRRECPEIGDGTATPVDGPDIGPQVLAHRAQSPSGIVLFLHNLSSTTTDVVLREADLAGMDPSHVEEMFADGHGKPLEAGRRGTLVIQDQSIDLPPFGYRWIRLRRNA
jgi:maltose alpha-D-glucosyltransferase/alpha-amylase